MSSTIKRLSPLTGLRGVAALCILLGHSIASSFIYDGVNLFQPFAARLCYFAMSLFFILSGFVIHSNYAQLIQSQGIIKGVYDFFVARFARLYPLYALALLFTLDGIPSGCFHNRQWAELSYLTLTQSWFNLQGITFPPAWSISTECFFYMAFIILLPLLEKIRKPVLALGVFTVIIFLFLPNLIAFYIKLTADQSGWVIYFSPFTRIFEFIAGILASKVYLSLESREPMQDRIAIYIAIILCMAWCGAILFVDLFSKGRFAILLSNFVFAPAIAPLLILSCRYDTLLSRILSSRPLLFMGEISYSIYLWQFTVITGVAASYTYRIYNRINGMAYINSCIKMAAIMGITTFIAYGSYNLFEKPTRRFLRNRLTIKSTIKSVDSLPEGVAYDVK